jgi:Patatin-like phospholipase
VVQYLALSGGAGDGAFGAGVLVGWTQRQDRPRFEVMTGVSAGALIAPFAFLGPRYDRQLREIWTKYDTDELATPQIFAGLLGAEALADSAPLKSLIARYVDRRMLDRIADEYHAGRVLLVGTTNLDAQRPVIWNMGEIAASRHPYALELFRQVILASVSVPGVFAPVHIKVRAGEQILEEMHVDGGPTRQVFVAPAQLSLRSFDPLYPTPPVRRIYIIKNGKLSTSKQMRWLSARVPFSRSPRARASATSIASMTWRSVTGPSSASCLFQPTSLRRPTRPSTRST